MRDKDTSLLTKEWRFTGGMREPSFRYVAELGISPFVAKLLYQRGFTNTEKAKAHIRPSLKALHDPDQLPDIGPATEALCTAIRANHRVLIYGDYDVDGITGCAVLYRVLKALKADVHPYIPNRFHDGYGLRVEPLERIFDSAPKPHLVVTVDNGVVAFEAAEMLASKNVSLIIADHHRMDESRLPEAHAVLHPGRHKSEYPNKNLCGAGVAFKLAWATARRFHGGSKLPPPLRNLLLESMSLVAMGTVADVMPLTDENRIFVTHGLKALQSGPSHGLEALLKQCGVRGELNSSSIGFQIGPRINAAGRLGSGMRALNLLVSDDPDESKRLASELEAENNARKEIQEELEHQAFDQVTEIYGVTPKIAGLVTAKAEWHEGVVGIVASRLVERYSRPSIVLAILEDGRAKGSGRTYFGVDLKAALDECAHLLTGYGGHEAAVGLQLQADRIPEFRDAFAVAVAKQMGCQEGVEVEVKAPALKLDAQVDVSEISETVVTQLGLLEPHGFGNRKPTFAATVELSGAPSIMGKDGKHLSFFISQNGKRVRCIMWGGAALFDDLEALARRPRSHDRSFQIAFRPKINEWRGRRSVEYTIQDLKI